LEPKHIPQPGPGQFYASGLRHYPIQQLRHPGHVLCQHAEPIGSFHWACVRNETAIEARAVEVGFGQTDKSHDSWMNRRVQAAQKTSSLDHGHLLTYLITSLLTPWSRVRLEKPIGFQLVKKFPAFYRTRRFITAFTSTHHLSLS